MGNKGQEKKMEVVTLCETTYYYWRFWIKEILKGTGARFRKNVDGWNGIVVVNNNELEQTSKLLAEFKQNNPDAKDLWR